MRFIDMKCPACGGIVDQRISGNIAVCEYCGSRFVLDDEEASAFADDAGSAQGDYEGSSLSMEDFASEACADFLAECNNGNSFNEAPKILRGLGIPDGERVFLIHDDTFFKSGKNGFAVTERGLYCRELVEDATFTPWSTFAKLGTPDLEDSYVKCGKKSVCYFTDDNDLLGELLDLYQRLHEHAIRKA